MLVLNVIMILFPIAAILYVSADNPNVLPLSEDVITTSINYNLEAEDTLKETDPKQLIKAVDEMRLLRPSINARSCNDNVLNMGKKTPTGVYFDGRNLISAVTYNNTLPENCMELKNNGYNISGIYRIMPKSATKPFPVFCDMEIKGGGWTYIQNRFDGSEEFHLNYHDYKFGFGDLNGEFWLGLHNIRSLARQEDWNSLLVEIVDRDNQPVYAHYYTFGIGPESKGFRLTVDGYSGNAGDSLNIHKDQKFATYDYDTTNGCAAKYTGGWWFRNCFNSNLNGRHLNAETVDKYSHGMYWETYRGVGYIHAKSRMLVKPNL